MSGDFIVVERLAVEEIESQEGPHPLVEWLLEYEHGIVCRWRTIAARIVRFGHRRIVLDGVAVRKRYDSELWVKVALWRLASTAYAVALPARAAYVRRRCSR